MDNKQSYATALKELTDVVTKLENLDVPIDELIGEVDKAKELIDYCKAKLRDLEDSLDTKE